MEMSEKRKYSTAGVYLTADEFKGKKDVVRGSAAFRVSPALRKPETRNQKRDGPSAATRNAKRGKVEPEKSAALLSAFRV